MELSEIKHLPNDQVRVELEKAREKLFRIRFQAKGKDIENPGQIRVVRKSIAQMLTVIRARELSGTEERVGTE